MDEYNAVGSCELEIHPPRSNSLGGESPQVSDVFIRLHLKLGSKLSYVRVLDCDLRTDVDGCCSKPHSPQECHASLHASYDPLHRSGAPSHKRDVCPVGFNEGYLQANNCMLLKIFLATLFLLACLLFFNHFETIAPEVSKQASIILDSVNDGFNSLLGQLKSLKIMP